MLKTCRQSELFGIIMLWLITYAVGFMKHSCIINSQINSTTRCHMSSPINIGESLIAGSVFWPISQTINKMTTGRLLMRIAMFNSQYSHLVRFWIWKLIHNIDWKDDEVQLCCRLYVFPFPLADAFWRCYKRRIWKHCDIIQNCLNGFNLIQ